jgi:hypothetical protein
MGDSPFFDLYRAGQVKPVSATFIAKAEKCRILREALSHFLPLQVLDESQ